MFFDNFLNLCNQRNLSPSAAVVEMGFQKSVVTRWKKSVPTDANKLKIANYFGITVDELMGECKKEKPASNGELTQDDFTYAMQNEAKELTEADKELLLSMAKQLNDARKKNGKIG